MEGQEERDGGQREEGNSRTSRGGKWRTRRGRWKDREKREMEGQREEGDGMTRLKYRTCPPLVHKTTPSQAPVPDCQRYILVTKNVLNNYLT